MEIELPAYEEIYDFNENELNRQLNSISAALTGVGLTEKWQRKANKIIELIQIELDERVVVNKITSFCDKEINSDLYQEIVNEELTQASTDKPDEDQEKLWNLRKKKNYKDMVRNTLKNTHQGTDLKIGGSSVPLVKVQKIEEVKVKGKIDVKEKSISKSEVMKPAVKKPPIKKPERVVANEKAKLGKGGKVEEKGKKIGSCGKEKISLQSKSTGNSDIGSKTVEVVKEVGISIDLSSISEIEAKSEVIEKEQGPDSNFFYDENSTEKSFRKDFEMSTEKSSENNFRKDIEISTEKSIEKSLRKDIEISSEISSESNFRKDFEKSTEKSKVKSIERNVKNTIEKSDENFAIEKVQFAKDLTGKIIYDEQKEELNDLYQSSIEFAPPNQQKPEIVPEKFTNLSDSSNESIKNVYHPTTLQSPKSKLSQLKSYPAESISNPHLESKEDSSFSNKLPKLTNLPSNENPLPPSLTEENKESPLISQISDTEFPSESKKIILKENPIIESQRVTGKIAAYEPDMAGLLELKALKEKVREQRLKESKKPVLNPVASKEKLESKNPLPLKKPELKTPQKPRVKPLEEVTDYSDLYTSFFDLFAGNKISKDFNPLFALRDVHTMFKEFLVLLDSPEFDVHRKFKLSLAPLEVNPRDLVRGNETLIQSLPSDKEMYYRVVKARPEVYDIVSRGFNKKKGWSELPHGMNLRLSWNVMWTWSKPGIDMSKLLIWQRVNHFPETRNFSRKDLLKKNIEKIMKISQKCGIMWNITPVTYVLPKEYVQFVDHYAKQVENNPSDNVWIMKPVGKSRGRGISVVNDVNQVSYGEIMVIQKYVTNPLLLDGFKFDLRLYILITSFSPLEVFIYKEGFARMSTVPFSLNPDKLHNKFIHLTNASIQKHNTNPKNDSLDNILGGSKICFKTLIERLSKLNVNWDKIWQQIIELVLKSLIAVQSEIPSYPCCFDLVGYDVMIDQNLQTWLIEINSSPSLARENYLDDFIKQQLIDDTLDLIDPVHFNKIELLKVLERRISEVQKGHINNSANQMNSDFTKILEGKKPRKLGETPEKIGNYEMISPSPLSEKLCKIANPRS